MAARVRDEARRRLAAQVAEAEARAKRAEDTASVVWEALARRERAEAKLSDARERADTAHAEALAKATAKLDERRDLAVSKAQDTHAADVGKIDVAIAAAVLALLNDGHSADDVAALTGLKVSEVRVIKRGHADERTPDLAAGPVGEQVAG